MDLPDFWKKIKRLEKIKINISKQYRSELGHALASFAFAVQNCSIIKGNAPMLNRHEIGHAPASLASAKGKTVFINKARSEAV